MPRPIDKERKLRTNYYRKHTIEIMMSALRLVENGNSIRTAAKTSKIPYPTLRSFVKKKSEHGDNISLVPREMSAKKKTMKNKTESKTIVKMELRKNNDTSKLTIHPQSKSQNQSTTKEILPEITKREIINKKITLKAKPNLKPINKRKGVCPKQDSNYIEVRLRRKFIKYRKDNKKFNKMSVPEVIHAMDVENSMTDEDFMDILTCPSPVWWEHDQTLTQNLDNEPEPEKSTNNPSVEPKNEDKTIKNENKVEINDIIEENPLILPQITEEKFEQIFLEKRLTLEKLLTGIKNNENKHENISNLNVESDESNRVMDEVLSFDENMYEDYTDIEILQNSDISLNTTDDNNDDEKVTSETNNSENNTNAETIEEKQNFTSENRSNRNSTNMEFNDTVISSTNESMVNKFENNINVPTEEKQRKSNEMVECLVIEGNDPCCSKFLDEIKTPEDTNLVEPHDYKTDEIVDEKKNKAKKVSPKKSDLQLPNKISKKGKSPKKCNVDEISSKTTLKDKKDDSLSEMNNKDILKRYVSILKNNILLKKNLKNISETSNCTGKDNNSNNNNNSEELKEKCNSAEVEMQHFKETSGEDSNQETLKS